MAQNLLQVMRNCSAVVLSYFDAGFEPQCPHKEFSCICCCCCLSLLIAVTRSLLPLRPVVSTPWYFTQRIIQHHPCHLSVWTLGMEERKGASLRYARPTQDAWPQPNQRVVGGKGLVVVCMVL